MALDNRIFRHGKPKKPRVNHLLSLRSPANAPVFFGFPTLTRFPHRMVPADDDLLFVVVLGLSLLSCSRLPPPPPPPPPLLVHPLVAFFPIAVHLLVLSKYHKYGTRLGERGFLFSTILSATAQETDHLSSPVPAHFSLQFCASLLSAHWVMQDTGHVLFSSRHRIQCEVQ